jgi:Catechol dioxygenase N terminus
VENVLPRKFSGSTIEDEASLTDKVLAAMHGAANPRLREVMAALVRHLHAFAREVHLTEEEFETGIVDK